MSKALDRWNTTKATHKDLADRKQYKADLTPLFVQIDSLRDQRGDLQIKADKFDEARDAQKQKNEAARDAKFATVEAARSKIADATRAVMASIRKVFETAGDWTTPIGPLAAKYDDLIKKYQLLDKQREKIEAEFVAANKLADKTFGDQKAAAVAQADKKDDEAIKLRQQLGRALDDYRAIARKAGNDKLSVDLDRVRDDLMGGP